MRVRIHDSWLLGATVGQRGMGAWQETRRHV